jgi:PPOX class probable F420-dependent enzyme
MPLVEARPLPSARAQNIRNVAAVCYRWTAMSLAPNRLSSFADQRHLNLETYRRTGQPVTTPVWFAVDREIVYVYTLADSGKVKRIRKNPRVRIAPCDARGALKGTWMQATARIVDEGEAARAHTLLVAKYGWMKRLADLFRKIRPKPRAVIAIVAHPDLTGSSAVS